MIKQQRNGLSTSKTEKNKQIKSIIKEHKLDSNEAKVFRDISTKKLVSSDQLYKSNNKKDIDSTLQKLKKKNLVKEFDVSRKKMFVVKEKNPIKN